MTDLIPRARKEWAEDEAMNTPKVLNPPKEIWLCYGEIEEDAEHSDCDEVTWCEEQQDNADVRYVLAEEQKP